MNHISINDEIAREFARCGCAFCASLRRGLARIAESRQTSDLTDSLDAVHDLRAVVLSCSCGPCQAAQVYDAYARQENIDIGDAEAKLQAFLDECPEELADISRMMTQAAN